jgi:hypothetical protein
MASRTVRGPDADFIFLADDVLIGIDVFRIRLG